MSQIPRTDHSVTQGQRQPMDSRWYRFLRGLEFGVVPPKGIVFANLTAADVAASFDTTGLAKTGSSYDGWAICNGSNGTPNLTDRFVRAKVSGAGSTGGSDSSAHTHAIDHDHGTVGSGAESGHTHAIDHNHAAVFSGSESFDEVVAAGAGSTVAGNNHTHSVDVAALTGSSGASSGHTHSVAVGALSGTSGSASSSENRPSYYELVPLMRMEVA